MHGMNLNRIPYLFAGLLRLYSVAKEMQESRLPRFVQNFNLEVLRFSALLLFVAFALFAQ
jgi:hypothetical protein